MSLTAAIDLGGTHVRAAVVAEDGTVLSRHRRPTPVDDQRPTVLADLVVDVARNRPLDRAVVGLPGVIDQESEVLLRAPNLPPSWIPHLTGDWLDRALGLPVSLANDADLAAVGEAAFGAGRGRRDVIYVTISTGVGAGIVVDRSLVRGRRSGGEIGHTIIDRDAADRGQPATVEALGAGPAIAAAAAAAGLDQRDEELADLVRAGHPPAVELWDRAITAVGLGVANLAWLVAPEIVVIGGGVGNNSDIVLPIIDRTLRRHGPPLAPGVKVASAALGDDAALAGAAAWFAAIGRPMTSPEGV